MIAEVIATNKMTAHDNYLMEKRMKAKQNKASK